MPIIDVTVSAAPDERLVRTIADGVAERTSGVLHKSRDVTAVVVRFVPPEHWIVAGRSLASQGLASFWLDVKITDGTNTKVEKAEFLRQIFAFMRSVLGPLHDESYVLVHDARADAYGYGGRTQESRFVEAELARSGGA